MCQTKPEFDMHEFLDMVETSPFLYDKRHENFKDRNLKRKIWNEVGEHFGFEGPHGSGEVAKTKFRNARDKYTKIKTEIRTAKRLNVNGVVKVPWPYFKKLQTMVDPGFSWEIVSEDGADVSSVASPVASPNVPAPTALAPAPNSSTEPYQEVARFPGEHLEAPQERRRDQEWLDSSPIHLQCMLVASKIRRMAPEDQIDALHEIDQVVYRYEKRAVRNLTTSEHNYS
ncbi:hypothetical protein HPB47_008327 [Ixodes persulcatus]|uniref:Uncharacterized protein n=1 Tax=Ixodes persulcatus TaxID=34615 RepID=A0AC60P532_IXOPE|nr:hypothetical protein HPB47_008327 [Ixodes persulcatus]